LDNVYLTAKITLSEYDLFMTSFTNSAISET